MIKLLILAVLIGACQKPDKEVTVDRVEARQFPKPPERPRPIPEPPRPGFITFDSFEQTLSEDAENLSSQDALNAFYLVGCERFNIDEEMEQFTQGVDKGINQLSTERFLRRTTPVGPCVFRIDQDDYAISNEELELIASRALFPVVSNTTRGNTIKFYLQKEITWLFASDFFCTAFECDVLTDHQGTTYRALVAQPDLDIDFFAQEGIDVQAAFDAQEITTGGTNDSPIAFGSRLFWHAEGDNGWIHVANDTSLAEPGSINETPFFIEQALASSDSVYGRLPLTDKIFPFVARETFYSLPNGLQGVRLSDGVQGLSAAPANVVQDNRADIDGLEPVIRLGHCFDCHSKGSIGYTDELNRHINSRSNFNEDEKLIANIFFRDVLNQQSFRETDEALARALDQVGIRNVLRDPLNRRLMTPMRKPWDVNEASALFFMTPDQYRDCLSGGNDIAQNLGAHLTGDQATLQVLHDNFQQVIQECNLFQNIEL